jgi:hypothetical protein
LSDFNRLVTSIQAKGIEPATGIFVPEFAKHSGQKPDEQGILKPINYYSLKWSWMERKDWSIIEQAAVVLANNGNLARMIDLEGTRQMACLDHLAPHEIASLIAAYMQTEMTDSLELPGKEESMLPALSEKRPVEIY